MSLILAVALAAQLADLLMTLHGLAAGGTEGNPIAVWLIETLGPTGGVLALKSPVPLFCLEARNRTAVAICGLIGAASWLL